MIVSKIHIAIVEDEENAFKTLEGYLLKFADENDIRIEISYFPDSYSYLEKKQVYDLIFLDIEMPGLNGMELAKKIRQNDENAIIVFITNMVQYAIKGYEVNALDYVLKPINYHRLVSLMKRTMRILNQNSNDELVLKTTGGMAKIYMSSIYYLDISDHLLIYHTQQGDFQVWQSLSGAESMLPKENFTRCNHSTIVNLKYVKGTDKDVIIMEGDKKIPISHSKKKSFLTALNTYLGL